MSTPAEAVGANVKRLRSRVPLSLRQLAARLEQIGHPIGADALNRMEMGKRQATVGDLVALAVVLDVSPMTLVMPAEPGTVQLTPEVRAKWDSAWRWATGDQPLVREGEPPLTLDDWSRLSRHVEVNRPYEASPVKEISWFLLKRFGRQPWSVDLRHDGDGGVKGSIRFHSEVGDGERQPED